MEVAPTSIQLQASLIIQEVAPPVVREDVAPSVQEAVEVLQEEAPVIEEVVEVVQERAPVVQEEALVVQDTVTSLTLPAPPTSTPLLTSSQDWAESDAREAFDALSSKLDNAKITLDEATEDLSEAKVHEEKLQSVGNAWN
ncbi:hypothetical protein H6P81_002207 [Aristolochia fimbriata]|uniref:Uncharacterized protein n=1 Tax=Aristolochia fimbriata TaxID=158543 RepID=A0AAV7FAR9_ARIFI|nr:hypothetical protein H6P81_002207 [Aristolochia fimbriata]